MTAVAPAGTAAPVEIRIASPALSKCWVGVPARDSPTTANSRPPGPAITAYPSIAEHGNGGTSPVARTSSGQYAAQRIIDLDALGSERRDSP